MHRNLFYFYSFTGLFWLRHNWFRCCRNSCCRNGPFSLGYLSRGFKTSFSKLGLSSTTLLLPLPLEELGTLSSKIGLVGLSGEGDVASFSNST